jgi:hypothetical protein
MTNRRRRIACSSSSSPTIRRSPAALPRFPPPHTHDPRTTLYIHTVSPATWNGSKSSTYWPMRQSTMRPAQAVARPNPARAVSKGSAPAPARAFATVSRRAATVCHCRKYCSPISACTTARIASIVVRAVCRVHASRLVRSSNSRVDLTAQRNRIGSSEKVTLKPSLARHPRWFDYLLPTDPTLSVARKAKLTFSR